MGATTVIIRSVFLALLCITSLHAADDPTHVDTLQGKIDLPNGIFPLLNPPSPSPDRRSVIGNALLSEFEQLLISQYPDHLSSLRGNPSAVSMCIDWSKVEYRDLGFMGKHIFPGAVNYFWHWGKDSSPSAQSELVSQQCRAAVPPDENKNCVCQPFLRNMSLDMPVPPAEEARISKEIPLEYYGLERFKQSRLTILLNEAAQTPSRAGQAAFLKMAPARPISIAYPFFDREYGARCYRNYTYDYTRAANESSSITKSALNSLVDKGLYGCEKAEPDISPRESSADRSKKSEEYCKYVYSENVTNTDFSNSSPETKLLPTLAWFEVTARVQSDGKVLELQPYVKPIALEASEGYFLGFEIDWPRPDWACAINASIPGRKILSIEGCDKSTCTKPVQDKFLEAIMSGLSNDTIAAIQGNPIGPDETLLTRDTQPSLVLGPPYYECSTYLVRPYSGDSNDVLQDILSQSRGTGHGSNLYLNIAHILTVTPNKLDKCSEPSRGQIQMYATAIANALTKIITKTCDNLNGNLEDQVCHTKVSEGESK